MQDIVTESNISGGKHCRQNRPSLEGTAWRLREDQRMVEREDGNTASYLAVRARDTCVGSSIPDIAWTAHTRHYSRNARLHSN